MVKYISKLETYNKILKDAEEAKKVVIIDYTAAWCGPCRMIAPFFADLEAKSDSSKFEFYKIDTDGEAPADQVVAADVGKTNDEQDKGLYAGITAMPTFRAHYFNRSPTEVAEFKGADKTALENLVNNA